MTKFEREIEDRMERLRQALEKVQEAQMYAEEAREAAEEVGVDFDTKVIDLLEDTEMDLQSAVDEAEDLLTKLEELIG